MFDRRNLCPHLRAANAVWRIGFRKRLLLQTLMVGYTVALSAILYAEPASPSPLPANPILRLESGTHSAPITCISADANIRYVATASLDKTVRIWDASTGTALLILRPPIDSSDGGKLLAVAFTPDGSAVACGGLTGVIDNQTSVYIFDRVNGHVLRRLTGQSGAVTALAYSRDGRYLAAGTEAGSLSIYRTSDYDQVGSDDQCGNIQSIDFAPTDDKLAPLRVAIDNGNVSLYKFLEAAQPPLRLIAENSLLTENPHLGDCTGTLTFSPNGDYLAAGCKEVPKVYVLSGGDLSLLSSHSIPGTTGNLQSVCWSSSGSNLYAAGEISSDDVITHKIYSWQTADDDDTHVVRLAAADEQVVGLIGLKGGGVIFGASDIAFARIDANGGRTSYHKSPRASNNASNDLASDDLLASSDGYTVQFKMDISTNIAQFNLKKRTLTMTQGSDRTQGSNGSSPGLAALKPAIKVRPGVAISEGEPPEFNGKKLTLDPGTVCFCHSISPDEQAFVLGTDTSIECFDQDLTQKWSHPTSSKVCKVNICGNGKIAIAALDDGTIRWYRMVDGRELCTFFLDADLKRWVAWTASYDYDVSPGGEELFGWHINHGLDHSADFFPGSHFHLEHFQPQLVASALEAPLGEALPSDNQAQSTPSAVAPWLNARADHNEPLSVSIKKNPRNEVVDRLSWGAYKVLLEKVIKSSDGFSEDYEQLRLVDSRGKTVRTIRDLYISQLTICRLLGDATGELCFVTNGGGRLPADNFAAYTQMGGLHNILFCSALVSVSLKALGRDHLYGLILRRALAGPPELTYHEYPVVTQIYVWDGVRFANKSTDFPALSLSGATQAQASFLQDDHGDLGKINVAECALSALQYLVDMTAIGRQNEADRWLNIHSPQSIKKWFSRNHRLKTDDLRMVEEQQQLSTVNDRALIDKTN